MEVFELFSGDKMVTYGNGDFISNSIHKHGCWEPNVTDTFINILKNFIYNYNKIPNFYIKFFYQTNT